jgi:hypothetical protein
MFCWCVPFHDYWMLGWIADEGVARGYLWARVVGGLACKSVTVWQSWG